MRSPDKPLEIVVKMKANGDFTVESSSRESYRVYHALRGVVQAMTSEINRQSGKLLLGGNHTDRFERSIG